MKKTSMPPRHSIETAYSFFHQKLRVYAHSSLPWQRDDIELAVGDYAQTMDTELYAQLAQGDPTFLRDHTHFDKHLAQAVATLEHMLFG